MGRHRAYPCKAVRAADDDLRSIKATEMNWEFEWRAVCRAASTTLHTVRQKNMGVWTDESIQGETMADRRD